MDVKKELYEQALNHILKVIDRTKDIYIDKYPHVSSENIYPAENNDIWTASFYPGMCYLAYDVTGDKKYLEHSKDYLDSFSERLNLRKGISHDLGFLYTLTGVADYKLTGNIRAYEIAQKAADMLSERFNEKGKYIQAWGEMGIGYPDVKIIIDTMLNLPLLYWAGGRYFDIAKHHAETAGTYLIREDYSSFHTYLMEPETGRAVCGKTHQGHTDASTWARGQAWAVYGFILSYRYTKEERFLRIAKETAEVFLKNLPKDFIPYWDFDFTDENPDIRDTSAASIACCGLLELCKYVGEADALRYAEAVHAMIKSLYENYSTKADETAGALLNEGMYHRDRGAEHVIWGDYYYFEAIVRLLKDFDLYW